MSKRIDELTKKLNSYEVTDPDRQVSAEEYNTILETLQRHDKDFVDKKGYYPMMSVGFADNLVGRGEATPEQFVYQPTANDLSVLDEPARIVKIKGNSMVWNQQVLQMPFPYVNRVAIEQGDNVFNCTVNSISYPYVGIYYYKHTSEPRHPKFIANHIYAISCTYQGNKSATVQMSIGASAHNFSVESMKLVDLMLVGVYEGNSATWQLTAYIDNMEVGDTFTISNVKIYDLTMMFGAGNEPTTVEEFYTRIPIGMDIDVYNEGQLISMYTEAIKTVGFNQWDEQWTLGTILTTTGEIVNTTSSIRSKNYIPVFANTKYYIRRGASQREYVFFYDKEKKFIDANRTINTFTTPENCRFVMFRLDSAYGTTYKNDICINISHSGYKDGTYEPYETFTRELGVIGKYFPNGMRRAGDIYDSIEWDSTKQSWVAIQRVEERAYTSGDELNANVTTDNTTTHYALATPIVTEIEEELNLDYKVWDFGTEEALSRDISAPFRADILYSFNAVDTIRNNYLEIQNMKTQLGQMLNAVYAMQAQQTSLLTE